MEGREKTGVVRDGSARDRFGKKSSDIKVKAEIKVKRET